MNHYYTASAESDDQVNLKMSSPFPLDGIRYEAGVLYSMVASQGCLWQILLSNSVRRKEMIL